MVELALAELLAVVLGAVALATTDAAALSKMLLAWISKKLGVKPADIESYQQATDGDSDDATEGE